MSVAKLGIFLFDGAPDAATGQPLPCHWQWEYFPNKQTKMTAIIFFARRAATKQSSHTRPPGLLHRYALRNDGKGRKTKNNAY
jgi:hypothetical protein